MHVPGTQVSIPPLPTTNIPPVDQALTLAQATAQCLLDGVSQLNVSAFQTCVNNYMNPRTAAQRTAASAAKARWSATATTEP